MTASDSVTLKPCPFCEGKAFLFDEDGGYHVECSKCNVHTVSHVHEQNGGG